MPAYIPITEIETDPEAPLTSELAKKWRDNPLAIAEGASGITPRILIGALERLNPGAEIRSRNEAAISAPGVAHNFYFLQAGTVRCTLIQTVNTGTQVVAVRRVRNEAPVDLASWGTGAGTFFRSTDIPVIPGDQIQFVLITNTGSGTLSFCRIQTNGESLWPGGASNRVEGNLFL